MNNFKGNSFSQWFRVNKSHFCPNLSALFFLILECGWVFPFVIACSYYAKPNQKILEFLMFQHLIALHIIKHHQHEMLILWSNVKKSWKTLTGKLTEAILFIYSLHACVQNKKKKFCFLCSPWPIYINPNWAHMSSK